MSSTIAFSCQDRPDAEFRTGWPAVLACFATAIFAWGFGFYGQGVYLAELQRMHGWSAALISSATTVYYLGGAVMLALVHGAIERLGPRALIAGGAVAMAAGAIALSRAAAPWQLYVGGLVMAAGWACTSTTAITTTLALWFDRRRGLAISLALNGASTAGFTVAPALVHFAHLHGLQGAVLTVALTGLAILLPLVFFGLGRRPAHSGDAGRGAGGPAEFTRSRDLLRDMGFWLVALPFALGLVAQVGFLVHQVPFLLPRLGADRTGLVVALTSGAAMFGRLALGAVIDRLDQRAVTAASLISQAVALLLMMSVAAPWALFTGSILFGLSVGNLITLPALIIQREFSARSFGLVIGLSTAVGQFAYSFGPVLLGLVHDAAGGYGPALALCMAIEITGALIVLRRPQPRPR
jgi:MFS family permease